MWSALHISPRVDTEFASSVKELLISASRSLILTVGAVYVALVFATAIWPEQLAIEVWLIFPLMGFLCIAAIKLLPSHFVIAHTVWQVGLAIVITLAAYLFQEPAIAFLYALLPLLAIVTIGWPAALLSEGVIALLLWWTSNELITPHPPPSYVLGILFGGVIAGLVGRASVHTLLVVTEWSLSSYRQAQARMDEALEQRVELKQTQQDLVQVTQQLARLSDHLKAVHRSAEEARRTKEEFVANVSHELRTPLNMIIGFSEMITQAPQVYGTNLPPALLSDIATIHLNSQHLSKLVSDVLDLSQIEAGQMALSKEWVHLKDIVETAFLAVRPLYESRDLYLRADIPAGLPALFCDSTRVREIILNLLSNAGRFTVRGGVHVRAWQEEGDIVVSVTDTGPGISEKDQERLFEPFHQLDSSIRRRHGGSGLGLSISKRFVEMHGGEMWLESQVGVGTTFFFRLPRETPLPADLFTEDSIKRWFSPYSEYEYRVRSQRSKAPVPAVLPRYVLMDKGPTLARIFSHYLANAELVSVRSAQAAVQELTRLPAQALIVNVASFDESPISRELLSALPYDTPAITCQVPGEDESAKQLGVLRYLVKPVTRETLLSVLEDMDGDVSSVLLVDDQPEALRLFARMLSSTERNYRILRAKNAQRALSLLRRHRPDVMFLDLIMPGMDGFQVLDEKRQDPAIREIPVVIVSSRDPRGEPIVSSELGLIRGRGLSVRDLLACFHAISQVLSPLDQAGDQARQAAPAG
jgi:signal transduction histidine kinase